MILDTWVIEESVRSRELFTIANFMKLTLECDLVPCSRVTEGQGQVRLSKTVRLAERFFGALAAPMLSAGFLVGVPLTLHQS